MATSVTDPEYISQNFRAFWTHSVVGLALVDTDGRWLDVNPAFCSLVEYTESELRSKTFHDITHPDDTHHHAEMLRAVLRGERKDYLMSKRYITKTGGIVWISLRVDRIEGVNGEFQHFFSQVQPHIKIERPQPRTVTTETMQGVYGVIARAAIRYWPQVCGILFVLSLLFGWLVELRVQWARTDTQEKRLERIEELIRIQQGRNAPAPRLPNEPARELRP